MRRIFPPSALVIALLITGTTGVGGAVALSSREPTGKPPTVSSPAAPTATPAAPAVAAPASALSTPSASSAPTPTPRVTPRRTFATHWRAFATVGPVTLRYPGDLVELVGFHESNDDGAQQQQPIRGAGRVALLDSRERGTRAQGAADIVVHPAQAVRAPVSGRVLRAGTYTLYCDYRDNYLVIEPDNRPGWEVKLLHFEGLAIGKGDRVRAGVTVVGSHARRLPFASQVDEHTSAPPWPHLHVEVVDPTIPDRPSEPCD